MIIKKCCNGSKINYILLRYIKHYGEFLLLLFLFRTEETIKYKKNQRGRDMLVKNVSRKAENLQKRPRGGRLNPQRVRAHQCPRCLTTAGRPLMYMQPKLIRGHPPTGGIKSLCSRKMIHRRKGSAQEVGLSRLGNERGGGRRDSSRAHQVSHVTIFGFTVRLALEYFVLAPLL
jgi:hypothetical protein